MSGERLRILHLTDLHLRRSLPGTAQQPKRLSRDMPNIVCCLGDRLDEWSPDVIALTGDLLDVPDEVVDGRLAKEDPEANAAAISNAGKDYLWMRDWLDGTDRHFVVIPGNHDHRGSFLTAFASVSPELSIGGYRFIGFDDNLDNRRTPERPETELSRFSDAVGRTEPQVHLQHYTLRPRLHRHTPYSYKPDATLADDLEKSGHVRLVLSGHYHPGAYARSNGGVVYSTAPAFCESPFRFRLVDLAGPYDINVVNVSLG